MLLYGRELGGCAWVTCVGGMLLVRRRRAVLRRRRRWSRLRRVLLVVGRARFAGDRRRISRLRHVGEKFEPCGQGEVPYDGLPDRLFSGKEMLSPREAGQDLRTEFQFLGCARAGSGRATRCRDASDGALIAALGASQGALCRQQRQSVSVTTDQACRVPWCEVAVAQGRVVLRAAANYNGTVKRTRPPFSVRSSTHNFAGTVTRLSRAARPKRRPEISKL